MNFIEKFDGKRIDRQHLTYPYYWKLLKEKILKGHFLSAKSIHVLIPCQKFHYNIILRMYLNWDATILWLPIIILYNAYMYIHKHVTMCPYIYYIQYFIYVGGG